MSVTFDGSNRLIIVDSGTTIIDVKVDLYSKWKLWQLQGDNSKYLPAISCIGGDPLIGGKYLGSTFFLENGWKIRPYEGNHMLTITGNLYSRDGSSPFVPTLGVYNVIINLSTSNLVDTIATGGAVVDSNSIATAVWNKQIDINHTASDYLKITPDVTVNADDIAKAVWEKDIATPKVNSYGEFLTKYVLTVMKYLGLK